MAATVRPGPVSTGSGRDDDGHRTFTVKLLVETSDYDDEAAVVRAAVDAAYPVGAAYALGNGADPWVFRKLGDKINITQEKEGDPTRFWSVELTYSSRPTPRCRDAQFDDPLDQPPKVSVGTAPYNVEGHFDRNGREIVNSAFERIRGPQNEWPVSLLVVKVEQNLADPFLTAVTAMRDTVNDAPLWGFPARSVKLSSFDLAKNYYGNCSVYYTRTLTFEIKYRAVSGVRESTTGTGTATGTLNDIDVGEVESWDRDVLDEGTKALYGHWGDGSAGDGGATGWVLDSFDSGGAFIPDPTNPAHFVRVTDRAGNPMRVILNGHGIPFDPSNTTSGTSDDEPGKVHVEFYGESDFTLLNIPTEI